MIRRTLVSSSCYTLNAMIVQMNSELVWYIPCITHILRMSIYCLLNFSFSQVFLLLQVSALAFLGTCFYLHQAEIRRLWEKGTYNPAIINPALNELSAQFGVSVITASYQTSVPLNQSLPISSNFSDRTVVIALNGICPFIFIPFANTYGRRPVYLVTTLIGSLSALGCAYAQNFGQLVGLRVLNGIFPVAYVPSVFLKRVGLIGVRSIQNCVRSGNGT